jgi:aminoglycoside phosphotransferase (APT) family kinase protein
MADAIAVLGELDPQAIGLQDFGRTEGFLERQVGRWRSQLESYAQLTGWPGPQVLPGVAEVADWLEAHRPPQGPPGILHGDFHLANVMFRHDSGELAAVVDWELSTLGDPLLDLGSLLAGWPEADGGPNALRVEPWEGFPTAAELLARYAQRSSRDVSHVRWFTVMACYKTAVILEGTHARACAGLAPKLSGERLHAAARRRIDKALVLGPGAI